MATKIVRKTSQMFGSTAGANQLGVIGSLAAGSPAYSADPAVIQSLANYLAGWFSVVVGSNSPAIEDLNALHFLFSYQISYLFQQGVPEYDSATPYFVGSIVQDGTGVLYTSLTGSGSSPNTGNALTSSANWRNISGGLNVVSLNPSTQSPYTMSASDNNKTFLINTANAAQTLILPAPSPNFGFRIKDSGFNANTNAITIQRYAAESFEGVASNYIFAAQGGELQIVSDGTNWFIIGR